MTNSGMNPNVREATPADAQELGTICFEAFKTVAEQHRFPPDFPHPAPAIDLIGQLIARPHVYSAVAEIGGRIAGSNFLWEDEVAGVGPLTISPDRQDSGIGRMLMEAVIQRARLRRIESVRLVQAAYHNRSLSLYARLGFDVREPLSVMQGAALSVQVDGRRVRPAAHADVEPAGELCRNVHGHRRSLEFRAAIDQGIAMVVEQAGTLTGYTTGVGFFGHSVGQTAEDLQALIGASRSFAGPGFLLPNRNTELLRWCLDHGLRIVQPMTLMSMGPYREPRGAHLPSVLY